MRQPTWDAHELESMRVPVFAQPLELTIAERSLSTADMSLLSAGAALAVCHANGMIHGDFHVANTTFVSVSGATYVLDASGGVPAELTPMHAAYDFVAPYLTLPTDRIPALLLGYGRRSRCGRRARTSSPRTSLPCSAWTWTTSCASTRSHGPRTRCWTVSRCTSTIPTSASKRPISTGSWSIYFLTRLFTTSRLFGHTIPPRRSHEPSTRSGVQWTLAWRGLGLSRDLLLRRLHNREIDAISSRLLRVHHELLRQYALALATAFGTAAVAGEHGVSNGFQAATAELNLVEAAIEHGVSDELLTRLYRRPHDFQFDGHLPALRGDG